jgi:hypothetical protein
MICSLHTDVTATGQQAVIERRTALFSVPSISDASAQQHQALRLCYIILFTTLIRYIKSFVQAVAIVVAHNRVGAHHLLVVSGWLVPHLS